VIIEFSMSVTYK